MIRWLKGRVRNVLTRLVEAVLSRVGYDVKMSQCQFHVPLDYALETVPPVYEPSVSIPSHALPLPPARARPGYAPDNDELYLDWGKSDHDFILDLIKKYIGEKRDLALLDFGCASGRVLRHFWVENHRLGWKLLGVDVEAYLIEWMRRNFPPEISVFTGSAFPHLPIPDNSLDVIYGISVFTHTKYLWDMWLMELKRVLKPGGYCFQSVQCEIAWRLYHQNRRVDWIRDGHPPSMLAKPEMDVDFFFYGNSHVGQQVFWKEEVLRRHWGRYLEVVAVLPPPKYSYQNWVVLRKPE